MPKPPPLPADHTVYHAVERLGRWPVGQAYQGHAQPGGPCTILFPEIVGAAIGPFISTFADEVARNRLLADLPVIGARHIGLDTKRRPFVVLPLTAGPDLETLVHHSGPLSPLAALQIGVQLAEILIPLHERNRALGELRPWMIRLPAQRDQRLSILDLGLCRGLFSGLIRPPRPTVYANEAVRAGQRPTAHDDLFALGAVIYFALTGLPPTGAPPSAHLRLGPFARLIDAAIMQALGGEGPEPIGTMSQLAHHLRGLRDLHRLSPVARIVALRQHGEQPNQPPRLPGTQPLPGGLLGFVEALRNA